MLVVSAGCSGGDDGATATSTIGPTAPTSAPDRPAAEGHRELAEFFVPLPVGYEYAPINADVEAEARRGLQSEPSKGLFSEIEMREVITSVGGNSLTVVVVRFITGTPPERKADFVQRSASQPGRTSKVVRLGDRDVTQSILTSGGDYRILHFGSDVLVAVSGQYRSDVADVARPIVNQQL